ncbi:MAG: peptidase inhibitor family I36 protein [Terracidiphilus sp.]
MRLRLGFALFVLLAATSLPALAQQQWGRPHPPRSGACFYRDSNFNGDYFCMRRGDRWPSMPRGFNDSISSIRVFGGARVRLFNDDNFQGATAMTDHDVDNLQHWRLRDDPSRSWNDRVSSILVIGDEDRDHDRDRMPQ